MTESATANPLEQEIVRLEQDLASKKAALEGQQAAGQIETLPPEKEILHSVVGEKINPSSITPPPSAPPSSGRGADQPISVGGELTGQVQGLVNIAFEQSIDEAIKQARATDNAALVDAFHDALVDELYNHLVERGKLKKI